jgi:hypothetical protein
MQAMTPEIPAATARDVPQTGVFADLAGNAEEELPPPGRV